ncbi:hypothetical protein PG997_009213 [Apiospora hydei]|uniref:Uncharacterized protein n=1 Tax=Apiospora hydei TaxID=1337664 RepID=A0ABR1VTF5_9PEZI
MENGLFTANTSAAGSSQPFHAKDDSGNSMAPDKPSSSGTGFSFNDFYLQRAEQLGWDTQRDRIIQEYNASQPAQQWADETSEDFRRIRQSLLEDGVPTKMLTSSFWCITHCQQAKDRVRESWIKQGIWKDSWGQTGPRRADSPSEPAWKHEEPIEVEPESDSETEEDPLTTTLFGAFGRLRKSREGRRWRAERRATRNRERDASRPYYRFMYQLGEERFAFQGRSFLNDSEVINSVDYNTKAYETVKARWVKRGIWDQRWGILPGMKWKHEQDLEGFLIELGPRPVTEYRRSGRKTVRTGNGSPQVADSYHDPEPSVVRSVEAEGPLVNTGTTRMHDPDADNPSESAQGAPSAIARARQSAGAQIMRRRLRRRSVGKRRRLARPAGVSKSQPKSAIKLEYEESSS